MTTSASRARRDDPSRLEALASVARELGSPELALDAEQTDTRLAEGRFYVACVGQFKRGKSTLLNALVGEPVLPTGVLPVTSAITVLRHGPRRARAALRDGRSLEVAPGELSRYVTEDGNPGNRLGVKVVEVFVPSDLLSHGLCLVDTPGIGSVFEANDVVTRSFVPHLDAALVVVGADPPVSGDERNLVQEVALRAGAVLVVLNKADRSTPEEQREGARFAREALESVLPRRIERVYEVSATEGLAGGASRDWTALVGALRQLAVSSGGALLASAEERAVERIARTLLNDVGVRREVLERPVQESTAWLHALGTQAAAAERALGDLGVLLSATQSRLTGEFRDRHERFLGPAQARARADLGRRFAPKARGRPKRRLGELAFEAARDVEREIVESFRLELEPEAERLYTSAVERFVELANELLEGAAFAADLQMQRLDVPEAIALRERSRFRRAELRYRTTRIPPMIALDMVLPRGIVEHGALRRATAYLDALVESNSSRVAADLVERAGASRERLEAELRMRIRAVLERARRAVSEARRRREDGAGAVARELERLRSIEDAVGALIATPEEGTRS